MDPVALAIQAVFYVLFGVAAWRYLRRRGAVERDVVGVFSTTAALFLLSFFSTFAPGLAGIVRPISIAILAAQPYLIVRLLGQIWSVPAWGRRLAFLAFVVTTVGILVLGSRSAPAVLALVAYFGITELLAAVQFLRLAGKRHGAHRLRLSLAGMATAMFGLAIVVAGVGSAAAGTAGSAASVQVASRLLALLAAFGYLGAFLPPRWLTGYFHRAAAFDLARQVVSVPAGQGPAVLWGQLAIAAKSLLGATSVRILDAGGRPVPIDRGGARAAASDSPIDVDAAPGPVAPTSSEVLIPLVVDGRPVGTLSADLEGRPLFVEDDVAIIGLLGSLTARSVQREHDMSRLQATQLALEESAAVQASEARFRTLLEADPNAILATDEDGLITWATRSSSELFGCADGDLVGRRLADLVEFHGGIPPAGPLDRNEIRRVETTARRADGSTLPVEVALRELDLLGMLTTVAIVADTSWRQEANQIRDRFVGVLSHELRTPITSIYGGAQLLLKRGSDLDTATRDDLLAGLADESERLQRMIENLLILDRVERGADFFGPRPVLIQRILHDVIDHERALWSSISIDLDIPEGLPVVTGDDDQLSQVLRNLLSNAVKYAGEGATITVRARYEEPWVRVTVADDGPGFPADEVDQLFGLYYRSPRSSAAPGAGIGLYVCRNLVEAMGGTISARSKPEGGAEFEFTLAPYVDLDELAEVPAAPANGRPGFTSEGLTAAAPS